MTFTACVAAHTADPQQMKAQQKCKGHFADGEPTWTTVRIVMLMFRAVYCPGSSCAVKKASSCVAIVYRTTVKNAA